jgi:hypothetical protein
MRMDVWPSSFILYFVFQSATQSQHVAARADWPVPVMKRCD